MALAEAVSCNFKYCRQKQMDWGTDRQTDCWTDGQLCVPMRLQCCCCCCCRCRQRRWRQCSLWRSLR